MLQVLGCFWLRLEKMTVVVGRFPVKHFIGVSMSAFTCYSKAIVRERFASAKHVKKHVRNVTKVGGNAVLTGL